MNVAQYIKYIQAEMQNQEYDDYVHVFNAYKTYLEDRLKKCVKDVEAACQLAAVYFELRWDTNASIDIMEALFRCASNEMSAKERARVYTNLAFFYEDSGAQEYCMRCLQKAVALNADYPNAYDALGRLYLENGYEQNILALFKKASALSSDMKYQYNYGVALFCNGNIAEAKAVFAVLLAKFSDERRILYAYGVCCFYTDDRKKAVEIADTLQMTENEDYILESELADLYFLCEEYAKHNELYERVCYATDISWLAPYFYALKALEDFDEFEKKLVAVVAEKNREIVKAQLNELDETYTEIDKIECIQLRQKEKDDIIQAHYKIKNDGYKPQLKIKLWLMEGCYLIDCPRHQDLL